MTIELRVVSQYQSSELDLYSCTCGAPRFYLDGVFLPIWRHEDDTNEDWWESSWSFPREAWTGTLDSHKDIQVGREKYQTFWEESRSLRPFWHQEASECERQFSLFVCLLSRAVEIIKHSCLSRLTCRKASNEVTQIFTIDQDRSWTTLNTSREVFEGLMSTYKIMPLFWRYMFTFGRKSEENEFEFPGFGQRWTKDPSSNSSTQGSSIELLFEHWRCSKIT